MTNIAKVRMLKTQTQAAFPYLIELYLPSGTKRYCNSDDDIVYEGNTYHGACFSVVPPSRDNETVSDGSLTFSAIDQSWIEWVRTINSRVKVRFVALIDYSENDTRVLEPLDDLVFTLVEAQWDSYTLQFSMMLDDRMAVSIPCDVASTKTIPAIA